LSIGRLVRAEGAWAICVCISYTGGEGQLRCNFLWSGEGVGVGRATVDNRCLTSCVLHREADKTKYTVMSQDQNAE